MEQERLEPVVIEDLVHIGEDRGLAKGRAEWLTTLARQFERRLRRELTEGERRALTERMETLGGGRLGDVVLDLAPDALAAWLADPDAR